MREVILIMCNNQSLLWLKYPKISFELLKHYFTKIELGVLYGLVYNSFPNHVFFTFCYIKTKNICNPLALSLKPLLNLSYAKFT